MFEDRLTYIRNKFTPLDNLGDQPIMLHGLQQACKNFSTFYGYEFIMRPLSASEKIDPKMVRGFSYSTLDHKYVVAINADHTHEKRWYFGAHECGHVLLHHLYLRPDNIARSVMQEVEEEAHFFAQLCFWPLNKITNLHKGPANEQAIIKMLADYQIQMFSLWNFKFLEHRLNMYAYLFLRRMQRLLPQNYQKLMNLYYPII